MRKPIHRDTNYIVFTAAINTPYTNAGGKYEAWKDGRGAWHVYDALTRSSFRTRPQVLRALISEIIAQAAADLPLAWQLTH